MGLFSILPNHRGSPNLPYYGQPRPDHDKHAMLPPVNSHVFVIDYSPVAALHACHDLAWVAHSTSKSRDPLWVRYPSLKYGTIYQKNYHVQLPFYLFLYFCYRVLINNIAKVTLADMKRVGEKYIAPVFDPNRSRVAICCHPTKVEEIVQGFKE